MGKYSRMTRAEADVARLADAQAEDDAAARERWRRRSEPTDEERMIDRLDAIIEDPNAVKAAHQINELARLLKWHITGSEF